MGLITSYRLRWMRRYWRLRARRRRGELRSVVNRTKKIRRGHILCCVTLRNERIRLPYFLKYYRAMGVQHFLIVDNGSDDGSTEYLEKQADVSLWRVEGSYKDAAFGLDWVNGLLGKYAPGHWTLTVDVDEFLVYPFCDTRPLRALTDWLDVSGRRSFGAMLLDMYPKGPLNARAYREGQDPFEIVSWFDHANYGYEAHPLLRNLWIQGGPRARMFFADAPQDAPALNKTPLVKWHPGYVYISSTHALLPRGLNAVYDEYGGEKASGVLLHAKFLDTFEEKAREELERQEHYAESAEYRAYARNLHESPDLWCQWSERYINWRQLEILGLMSSGNWA